VIAKAPRIRRKFHRKGSGTIEAAKKKPERSEHGPKGEIAGRGRPGTASIQKTRRKKKKSPGGEMHTSPARKGVHTERGPQ